MCFEYAASATQMAHEISNTNPAQWVSLARMPFERDVFIEWDHTVYTHSMESAKSVGLFADKHGTITVMMHDPRVSKYNVTPSIFGIAFDPPEDWLINREKEHRTQTQFAAMGWGPKFVAQYGLPINPAVYLEPLYKKLPAEESLAYAKEFAGQVRMACAVLALLNIEREVIHMPASSRHGRTMLGNRQVARYRPNLVVVRPDAPRIIRERAEEIERMASRKREHDVRSHWRRLKDGRRVPVRSHMRGDPALGHVHKRYIVEKNPEVIFEE